MAITFKYHDFFSSFSSRPFKNMLSNLTAFSMALEFKFSVPVNWPLNLYCH